MPRKRSQLILPALLLTALLSAPAQARPYELNTPEARSLSYVIDQVLLAHRQKDIKLLMAQFHPQVQALWSNGKVMHSHDELQQVYQESFLGYRDFQGRWLPDYADIEGNTAWITGEMSWTAMSIASQQPIHLTVRSTYILRRVNHQWLIVREHSSHRRSD